MLSDDPYGLNELGSPTKDATSPPLNLRSCLTKEPLLLFTLLGVIAGIALGASLRPANLSATAISLIGFPGELMLRLLKMLVLPLVAASMVSGMCALRAGTADQIKKLAQYTALFYTLSTVCAICLGLVLVTLIKPGRNAAFDKIATSSGCVGNEEAAQLAAHSENSSSSSSSNISSGGAAEALLHVARLVVPDNIAAAAVDTNVLGIITFSLLFGWALSSLGPQAAPAVAAAHTINAAVSKMVTAVLWVSPVGVGSLIASSILKACDVWGTMAALGLWLVTVIAGLLIFAFILLPAMLFFVTGRSPLTVASHFGQALALAFGTSSSAASLPLAMTAARSAGCSDAVVNFFLPLGIAINMNGTALYEATTALFIAQSHGVVLGPAEVLVVAATASLAAVGAPAIPSAGLVTMLIVLQAVGLDQYSGDLAVILALDWLLDRVRTAVNLLSDAFGCVCVDYALKKGINGGDEQQHHQHHVYARVEMGGISENGQI